MPRVRPPAEGGGGQLTLVFDVSAEPVPTDEPAAERAPDRVLEPATERASDRASEPAPVTEPDAGVATAGSRPPDRSADLGVDWRLVLDFERGWAGPLTAKQRAIRDSFGLSSARYHQLLDRALELPEALEHDPALVGRLRRLREARRGKRFARRVQVTG